jgi:hypothetical protein
MRSGSSEAYGWATAKKRKVGAAVTMLRLAEVQKQVAELIENA